MQCYWVFVSDAMWIVCVWSMYGCRCSYKMDWVSSFYSRLWLSEVGLDFNIGMDGHWPCLAVGVDVCTKVPWYWYWCSGIVMIFLWWYSCWCRRNDGGHILLMMAADSNYDGGDDGGCWWQSKMVDSDLLLFRDAPVALCSSLSWWSGGSLKGMMSITFVLMAMMMTIITMQYSFCCTV